MFFFLPFHYDFQKFHSPPHNSSENHLILLSVQASASVHFRFSSLKFCYPVAPGYPVAPCHFLLD